MQRQREQQRRAAMSRQQPVRKRKGLLSEEDRTTLKKILFMRISLDYVGAYLSRRMREQRRYLAARFAPLRMQLTMVGVYSRRAVLALGVVVVSIGIAGGVLHTG